MNLTSKIAIGRARRSPYVQTLLRDRQVHARLRQGAKSGRAAYLRATRRKDAADALLDDRRTRRELRRMTTAFREAGERVRGAKRRKRRREAMRLLVPAAAVGAGAAAVKSGLASKLFAAPPETGPEAATQTADTPPPGTVPPTGTVPPPGTA